MMFSCINRELDLEQKIKELEVKYEENTKEIKKLKQSNYLMSEIMNQKEI